MKRICIILLLLAGSAYAAFAQQQIQGKVTDDKGAPLEGVSVTVKGTNNGVTTSNDGSFVLKTNSSGKTVLIISYSGYKTIEVTSKGSTPLSVKMELGENKLEDVVVIGYGTRRQKDLTGSVSAVTSKDFNQGAVLSPQ
ncbi:MAG: carboxypeptidase-like regulatory domain-containing protein, partial [Flavisolibacter sp.]|nr:carboxypeptidase-like regulatory domain-containing protein [Flavisolibacter sp.]